eukprot:g574.t1
MGGDGGAKPLGRKFLRGAKKMGSKEAANKVEVSITKHSTCALTNEPLNEPIGCCRLGYLYNKEALITRLLEQSVPREFKHVKSLKDITTLSLTPNPAFKASKSSTSSSYWMCESGGKYLCPVTRLEFNGRHRFCVIWTSGVVLSLRCLKEIPHNELFEVAKVEFQNEDIVRIAPDVKEFEKMKDDLKEWKKARKLERKIRKRKMREETNLSVVKIATAGSKSGGIETPRMTLTKSSSAPTASDATMKRKKKRKKKKKDGANVTSLMRKAVNASEEALARITNTKKKNAVYASIFSSDAKDRSEKSSVKKRHSDNLFIRVAANHFGKM